ncbi:MAG: S9 family peptidase, partial [Xanthomonadales bacterium]|nr:S9 family peptidase [Xanthomonadales bacterium]
MKMVERNPGTVAGWITDHDGKIRGAFTQDKLYNEVWYRDSEEDEWQTVARFHYDDPKGIQPMGFAYDNKTWYVQSFQDKDTAGIYKYDPTSGELGELIFRHDEYDAGGLIWSDKQEKILGATYFTSKPHWVGLDEEFTAMMTGLENAFPDKVVNIVSLDDEEDTLVVSTSSDTDPGGFYLFDRSEGKLEPLVERMPWIDPADMTEMRPISYTSRDGLTIHGYLTTPKGSDGEDLPLIVNPHGGPWARDFWGFNPEHQFFASRGYAVLQMNFRGSTGYGRKHLTASYKQWGRNMQNDITDGVKWAIEEGIADPERVCIYGGSYGGYATMAGMVFTPELYKCGVNYVGVTDIALLFKTMPDRWNLGAAQMKDRVGDPETEEEFLAEISPVNHVENIRAPVFIVHGRKDPRVSIRHADILRDEMEEHGKPYEWMVKNDEGHGFAKQENRIELYTAMAEFFDKHIGSGASTGP